MDDRIERKGKRRSLLPIDVQPWKADRSGAQVGQEVLPGRGLVVMHRGEANPVVFAMSTSYMLVALIVLLGAT